MEPEVKIQRRKTRQCTLDNRRRGKALKGRPDGLLHLRRHRDTFLLDQSQYPRLSRSETALAVDKVRHLGEGIAAVAADTEAIANQALALIDFEITELKPFLRKSDSTRDLRADEEKIHEHCRGDNNIHKRVVQTRDAGIPVVVVSTELDEVVALADRIMVMYRGRIVGIVPGDTPREVLGLMMAGESPSTEGAAA